MDFSLTQEQLRWRDLARMFTAKIIKPDVMRRDRLPTAAERIPWDWIREADKQGIPSVALCNTCRTRSYCMDRYITFGFRAIATRPRTARTEAVPRLER